MMSILGIAAAGQAPSESYGPAGLDWAAIIVITAFICVAMLIGVVAAGVLHRSCGNRSLQVRTLLAAVFPVALYSTLIIATLAAFDGHQIDDAVIIFFSEMNAEGVLFFLGCFAGSWIAAFALGRWLRRRVVKSNHIDPAVFR